MTDRQIRQAHVGRPKRVDGPITLSEYDPNWPKDFSREAKRIKSILGKRALRIEHIGSTAVPGLIAKPIIDIILVVSDPADERSYVPPLEAAGYVLTIREPDWHQHRVFKGPDTNVNLHVFPKGSAAVSRHLAFRDWLRKNKADRDLYAKTKRELASRRWKYTQNYADAKTPVIDAILTRAATSPRLVARKRPSTVRSPA